MSDPATAFRGLSRCPRVNYSDWEMGGKYYPTKAPGFRFGFRSRTATAVLKERTSEEHLARRGDPRRFYEERHEVDQGFVAEPGTTVGECAVVFCLRELSDYLSRHRTCVAA